MTIQILKEDTYTFNSIAGNDKKLTMQDFLDQQAVLEEEVKELREGIEELDLDKMTDGAVDTIVVALGVIQKLETAGVNTDRAMQRIGQNNLEKYPRIEYDESIVQKTVDMYKEKGIEVDVSMSPLGHCWVFKNKLTGKILKPYGFKSVDLGECIPEHLKAAGDV